MINPTLQLKLERLYAQLRVAESMGKPTTANKIEAEIDRITQIMEENHG